MLIMNEQHIFDAMQQTSVIAGRMGFSSQQQLLLTLATEEALMNAYEHSYQKVGVEIEWVTHASHLDIFVKQLGPLFSLETTTDVNMAARGRGLQLILHIMDEISVEKAANGYITLKMTKKMSSPL